MPHATMKLIPGIDTNKTPALNEAAFSSSQLIRFIPDRNNFGLVQKLGGWVSWYGGTIPNINELHAWEDLSAVKRLAVGAASSLSLIKASDKSYSNITPQVDSSNSSLNPSQTATITIASPAVVTVSVAPPNGTPVVFSTTGALPTGLTAGTVYYVVNATATTFEVSATVGGSSINTSGTQSGVQTVKIPTFSITSGSTTVTIVDTSLNVQSATMASNVITVASAPFSGAEVSFSGASLPAGISATSVYYAIQLSSTTFSISSTVGGSVVAFGSGSGTSYQPNQIREGFNVYLKTPVSIGNLLLSGIYTVESYSSNNYYSVYTINAATAATSTTTSASLPTFTVTNGNSLVTVTEANHTYQTNDVATFLTSTTNSGVTIFGNYFVTYISATQYSIYANTAATATTTFTMNGDLVNFEYYYNTPSPFAISGYGTGGYGEGGYGIGEGISYPIGPTITVTDWVITNFGEVLVANAENGPIYYWSPSENTSTAYLLSTAPLINLGIFVAMPSRQLVAYGSTSTGIQDPLLIRWSDAEDQTVWTPTATNQAGSYRIPEGSLIVGGIQGPQQAFIWTDLAVWAMQYIGGQGVFGFNKLADGYGLIAKKAVGLLGNAIYWMSPNKFSYMAGQGVQTIPCPIWDQVFQNINTNLYSLIRCGTNSVFGEVIWYYPTAGSTYNNAYVKFNIYNQQWDYGTLDRTAWIDQSVLGTPIGSSENGTIFQHEQGYNNGSSPMISSFQTGYMQLNDADNLIFVDQIWPDFKWQTTDGSTTSATVYITFYGTNYPGDTPIEYGPYTVTQATEYISTRIRNRLLSISVSTSSDGETAALNTFFRIGALRYRYQIDGKF